MNSSYSRDEILLKGYLKESQSLRWKTVGRGDEDF